ncbi:MAG: hypothetical protein SO119_07680 [Phascolarctobacterium sp.]|nr:hypothetical protein [Phascolarctobacterium sp.]
MELFDPCLDKEIVMTTALWKIFWWIEEQDALWVREKLSFF